MHPAWLHLHNSVCPACAGITSLTCSGSPTTLPASWVSPLPTRGSCFLTPSPHTHSLGRQRTAVTAQHSNTTLPSISLFPSTDTSLFYFFNLCFLYRYLSSLLLCLQPPDLLVISQPMVNGKDNVSGEHGCGEEEEGCSLPITPPRQCQERGHSW